MLMVENSTIVANGQRLKLILKNNSSNFNPMINLNGIKMNVIETAPNGIVNKDTIFIFTQIKDRVYAEYAGGRIEKGFSCWKNYRSSTKIQLLSAQTDGNIDNEYLPANYQ